MEIPYTVTARKDTGLYNAKVGIWLFLASEVMLFGGLFSGYVFLRVYADYPWPERALPVVPGLINTFILIGSSVTVVFAWAALKMRRWRQFQIYMGITLVCALLFMVLKGIEYNSKWHHQAVRMKDFVIVEGHTHPATLTKDGELHFEHHGDDHVRLPTSQNGMMLAADNPEGHENGEEEHGNSDDGMGDGHEAEYRTNRVVFEAESILVDLENFHVPVIRDLMEQANKRGSEIKLVAPYAGRGSYKEGEEILAEKDTLLSVGLLKDLRSVYLDAKANNYTVKTKQNRDAWARVRSQDGNEEKPGYSLRDELEPDPEFDKFLVDTISAVSFSVEPPCNFVLNPHDVRESAESAVLVDTTTLNGELNQKGSAIALAADAIDFSFVAQRAEEKNIEPEAAIANTWIMKNNPEVKALWERHAAEVQILEEELLEEYGRDKNGNPKQEPTETERYRLTWQNLVNLGEGEEVKGVFSGFAGPNHKKDYAKHFPEVTIPREEVNLESKFTPRWNTYYAIYFLITGLHGLHVIGGVIVLGYFLFFGKKMYLRNPEHLANRVEVGGLFWHFVDLVWIFLFPILYLM
jgi:heme/copper-type cytochrome/quinol oxidase subunit 3